MSDNDDPKKTDLAQLESSPGTEAAASGAPTASSKPLLNRAVQAQLGQRLRHFYESLALGEQPVPDRFIEIIDRLSQANLDQSHPEKPQ